MDKRGQFFLIAAFVIIGILISLSTVYIAINAMPEEKKVYDLSKEINEETAQIISNGVINNPGIIETNIDSLAQSYSITYPDSEIAVIYGIPGAANIPSLRKYYKCDEGSFSLEASTTYTCVKTASLSPNLAVNSGGSNSVSINAKAKNTQLIVNLKGEIHDFTLPSNQESYFYIIVRTPKLGQRTVATAGSA